jgi:MFS transporter, MHS family, shikimate and dehydroshikimate transport protein
MNIAEQKTIKRIITASILGSVVEWYDYALYGTAAALVFSTLFFPKVDPAIGVLLSLSTFAIGFLFRPIAATILANIGDKVGRAKILVFTILLMGFSTIAIGCLPTYEQIGILAPILLVVLRICQACGAGAEYAGAILVIAERAPKEKRGFYSALPYIGVSSGVLLSTAVFSATKFITGDQFIVWGWRIPFLLSFICVLVGLWLRRGNLETPAFKEMKRSINQVKLPIVEVFKVSGNRLVIGWGLSIANFTLAFLFQTFLLSYVTNTLKVGGDLIVNALLVVAALQIIFIPFFGYLSDKYGRKPVLLFGTGLSILTTFPLFILLNTAIPIVIFFAFLFVNLISRGAIAGVEPVWFTELFETKVRYSGFAVGREWPSIMGGIAPVLAQAFVVKTDGGWWAIALMGTVVSVIAFICVYFGPDMKNKELSEIDSLYASKQAVT